MVSEMVTEASEVAVAPSAIPGTPLVAARGTLAAAKSLHGTTGDGQVLPGRTRLDTSKPREVGIWQFFHWAPPELVKSRLRRVSMHQKSHVMA